MPIAPETISPPTSLEEYIEVSRRRFTDCVAVVEHTERIDGVETKLRLHYVKFDGNGRPRFKALAHTLATHIVYYCVAAKRRPTPLSLDESAEFFIEARDYFRRSRKSGEPGELLLYFLVEAVLRAPQIVCKMELKTNREDETKGADGIHISYDRVTDCLTIYFCESKLISSYTAAIAKVFQSVTTFYDRRQEDHELKLVTKHFKLADDVLKAKVSAYVEGRSPSGLCRVVHACLVGFDWEEYKLLNTEERAFFVKEFSTRYLSFFTSSVKNKIRDRCASLSNKSLLFEFFFLPFNSVQEFRDEFYREILGE